MLQIKKKKKRNILHFVISGHVVNCINTSFYNFAILRLSEYLNLVFNELIYIFCKAKSGNQKYNEHSEREEKDKVKSDDKKTEIFLKLCTEEINIRNKLGTQFSRKGWKNLQ